MPAIATRSAEELKSELALAIERTRALLGESMPSGPGARLNTQTQSRDVGGDGHAGSEAAIEGFGSVPHSLPPDSQRDENQATCVDELDLTGLTDAELDALLRRINPKNASKNTAVKDLGARVMQNPLPWAIGASIAGVIAANLLFVPSSSGEAKIRRQKASHGGISAITHDSLIETIMKTGIDMIKPALLKASKDWLMRFVEK